MARNKAAAAAREAKAVYSKTLEVLKGLSVFGVDAFNMATGEHERLSFGSLEEMKEWLLEHDFGVKVFRNKKEKNDEYGCMLELYNMYVEHGRDDFLERFTCVATFSKGGIPYFAGEVAGMPAIVFKNADSDLRSPAYVTYFKKDARRQFVRVFRKCVSFLEFLHKHGMFYGDWKCRNVFTMGSKIVVGDYGSLRYFDDDAEEITKYTYTFKAPNDKKGFVDFWVKGKGSKFTFLRHLPKQFAHLFKEDNLRATLGYWSVVNDECIHESHELSRAVDWWALGVMLIELACYSQCAAVQNMIGALYDTFCLVPKLDMIHVDHKKLGST